MHSPTRAASKALSSKTGFAKRATSIWMSTASSAMTDSSARSAKKASLDLIASVLLVSSALGKTVRRAQQEAVVFAQRDFS